MRTIILYLFSIVCITNSNQVIGQTSQFTELEVPFLTYPFSDPDPIFSPDRHYPYFRFDGYTGNGVMHSWKMVEMENDYIKLWVTPEIGGKVWGAVEKSTGNEFIYFNDVVKFRDVAMRGPWTSGGIEFNFGVIGHAPWCSSPVDYLVQNNSDGSVSCFIGGIDLPSRTEWRVEIRLPSNEASFSTRSLWYNPLPVEQSYYQWTNAGIKASGNLEFIFPGNKYIGHEGKVFSWPEDSLGREISWYNKNDFGTYKSYHVFGSHSNFYGAYWHDEDFGMGHYNFYDDKPGRKIWIWGLSREGMIWEDLLTDNKGQYVEVQSGRLFNQAVPSSTGTPFKHRGFLPYTSETFVEYWFPVKNTQGISYASPAGAIHLIPENDSLKINFNTLQAINEELSIYYGDAIVKSWEINSSPMENFYFSVPFSGDLSKTSIKLGNQVFFNDKKVKSNLSRPSSSPDINWDLTYGQYLQGKAWMQQREFKLAEDHFRLSLRQDSSFIPSLTGLAALKIRAMNYDPALEVLKTALSINIYDPEANFLYGYVNLLLGNIADAIDGYSIAASSVEYRSAAYTELAGIYLSQGNYQLAIHYSNQSLKFNSLNISAYELLSAACRKSGLQEKAFETLNLLLEIDPLNHFARFEKYLSEPCESNLNEFKFFIRNEFPQETYLELALKYYRTGNVHEALEVLGLAPDNPVILYWKAWLLYKINQKDKAGVFLKMANEASPFLVFPFREETVPVFQWADENSGSWKPNYYLGLIFWNKGNLDMARELFNACGDAPDYDGFYLSKALLYKDVDPDTELYCLHKAESLNPNNWRTGMRLTEFFINNNNPVKAMETVRSYFDSDTSNYYLGLLLARTLLINERYPECVDLLTNIIVLPNEGAIDGRLHWREANIKSAAYLYKTGNFDKALQHIELAKQWPENLGVGKPYDTDERLDDYLKAIILERMGESIASKQILDELKSFDKFESVKSSDDFISAWILKRMGYLDVADRIMNNLMDKSPEDKNIRWSQAIYNGNRKEAEEILSETDIPAEVMPYEIVFIDSTFPILVWLDRYLSIFVSE